VRLKTAPGAAVPVTSVLIWHHQHLTHDLTVATTHTYYVLAGATPVLVHNCGGGGFKNPVSPGEITQLNRRFGGTVTERGTSENLMVRASRYGSFWEKSAVVIRDIAGGHMFVDENKRTAYGVVSRLKDRNGITSGPTSDELWSGNI
jgi:hypothetical protein